MVSRLRVALVAVLLIARPSAPGAAVETLAPEQLHRGQRALVKTVFEGEQIETFEAEILGVLAGGRAEGDLIVARGLGERVTHIGIAQGMSGSPVYVDGKLIGALSGGWSFTRDPLFVVTPIREMLEVADQPPLPADPGAGTPGPTGIEPRIEASFGGMRWPGAESAAPADEPPSTGAAGTEGVPAFLPVPLAVAGLDPALRTEAARLFAPLGFHAVPAGRSGAAPSAAPFEPGAAVAVELMRGDLQMAAIGTVTWRDGDRVLIFGHPFFQSGPVRLPLSSAVITTIVASDATSFKLGSAGRPLGTATQDRRAAVAGVVGPAPHLMPVGVTVAPGKAPEHRYRFESIDDRAMAPQLISLAALNSLLEAGGAGAGQTVRWTVTLHRHGAAALVLSDVASGEGPIADLTGGIGAPLRFLYGNPYAHLTLDSVAVRLESVPGRLQGTLRSARVLDPGVRPGGTVRVQCEVERWRGARESVTLALHVPEEVPEGRYVLWLGGGAELTRFESQRLPGRYRPASLDEAWRRLQSYRPADALYGALLARAPEVTRDGRDYPELPTSALALLAGGQSAEDVTRRGTQAFLDETRHGFDGPVRGELQLEIDVDPMAP